MPEQLTYRLAETRDAGAVAEIIRASFNGQAEKLGITRATFPSYVGFENTERVLRRFEGGDVIILAEYDGQPVGTIAVFTETGTSGVGYIKRFGILPSYRGRGWGESMMGYAEQLLRDRAVDVAEVSVVSNLEGLVAYYGRLGYQIKERIKHRNVPFETTYLQKKLRS